MAEFQITRRTYLIPAACLGFILFFTVFGERGLLRIYELRQEKRRIDDKVALLVTDNDKLKKEIIALKSDRRHLESIARKELGLVRTNEIIYQFPQNGK
jgi:cell division protein FtsB